MELRAGSSRASPTPAPRQPGATMSTIQAAPAATACTPAAPEQPVTSNSPQRQLREPHWARPCLHLPVNTVLVHQLLFADTLSDTERSNHAGSAPQPGAAGRWVQRENTPVKPGCFPERRAPAHTLQSEVAAES